MTSKKPQILRTRNTYVTRDLARENFKVVRVFACLLPLVLSRSRPTLPCHPSLPLFCSPIPFKTRKNEDHLRPSPRLRRFGRRLCPPGLQHGATKRSAKKPVEDGIFGAIRFGMVWFRRSEGVRGRARWQMASECSARKKLFLRNTSADASVR